MTRKSHVIKGLVFAGFGVARHSLGPHIEAIKAQTGMHGLVDGTLNVRLLNGAYVGHPDYIFRRGDYNPNEDTYFERCTIQGLRGLIMRTSTNAHGYGVLELMGEVKFREMFSLKDGDPVEVEVFDP